MFTKREQFMTHQSVSLSPGLYFVATPIGAARDITLRALDILASADVLAAEDTRTLKRLMQIHGVPVGARQIIAYHDHNGARVRPKLLAVLAGGKTVAYASEAGSPLIADPGFVLAKEVRAAGIDVFAAPGPSAVIAGLTVSGLPTDRFMFAGFPPTGKSARTKWLRELREVNATLVFYESPKRLSRTLAEMADILGAEREAAICRELTKKFEEVRRGPLNELAAAVSDAPVKGEVVLVIDRLRKSGDSGSLDDRLAAALTEMSVKDAAAFVAEELSLKRRLVYQRALELRGEEDRD